MIQQYRNNLIVDEDNDGSLKTIQKDATGGRVLYATIIITLSSSVDIIKSVFKNIYKTYCVF